MIFEVPKEQKSNILAANIHKAESDVSLQPLLHELVKSGSLWCMLHMQQLVKIPKE